MIPSSAGDAYFQPRANYTSPKTYKKYSRSKTYGVDLFMEWAAIRLESLLGCILDFFTQRAEKSTNRKRERETEACRKSVVWNGCFY